MAQRLALPTSDHGVAGSNPAGGEILPEPKRRFTAQSLSCSPSHRLEMTELLLKGRKTLIHPSIKKIVGRADFSDKFKKIIVRYKRIGYNINIMRQSACLVFNPITVNSFASLFNCAPVGRASDSMMAPT